MRGEEERPTPSVRRAAPRRSTQTPWKFPAGNDVKPAREPASSPVGQAIHHAIMYREGLGIVDYREERDGRCNRESPSGLPQEQRSRSCDGRGEAC